MYIFIWIWFSFWAGCARASLFEEKTYCSWAYNRWSEINQTVNYVDNMTVINKSIFERLVFRSFQRLKISKWPTVWTYKHAGSERFFSVKILFMLLAGETCPNKQHTDVLYHGCMVNLKWLLNNFWQNAVYGWAVFRNLNGLESLFSVHDIVVMLLVMGVWGKKLL